MKRHRMRNYIYTNKQLCIKNLLNSVVQEQHTYINNINVII